jgi:TrmH family RNA methyltransferase
VRPQAAGNIGALSRVMSNFGVTELRLVGPAPQDSHGDEAFSKMDWALACKGESVLSKARSYPSLREALESVHVALGTSGKKDPFLDLGYARPIVEATRAYEDLKNEMDSAPEALKWALVLGPEDDGLSAEEAALCKQLIHINTRDENPSINLAMAAGLLLYHWHLFNEGLFATSTENKTAARVEGTQAFPLEKGERLATLDEKELFLDYMVEALKKTQFFKYPDTAGAQARLRRWMHSTQAPLNELLYLFEAIYHFKCWGQGHFEERAFLKKK